MTVDRRGLYQNFDIAISKIIVTWRSDLYGTQDILALSLAPPPHSLYYLHPSHRRTALNVSQ